MFQVKVFRSSRLINHTLLPDYICKYSLALGTQPQPADFLRQLAFCTMSAGISIEACNSSRIDKIVVQGIDMRHFISQSRLTLQGELLVVLFGHGKGPDGEHFGSDSAAGFLLNRLPGSHRQFALLLIVVKDCFQVLPRH